MTQRLKIDTDVAASLTTGRMLCKKIEQIRDFVTWAFSGQASERSEFVHRCEVAAAEIMRQHPIFHHVVIPDHLREGDDTFDAMSADEKRAALGQWLQSEFKNGLPIAIVVERTLMFSTSVSTKVL